MRFNRASLYLAAACLSAIELIEPAFSDESLAYVLKGFAAQEHASRQRTEFVYRRENVSARYVIERIRPDRLHVIVIGPTGSRSEIYVIMDRFLSKSARSLATIASANEARGHSVEERDHPIDD